MGDSAPLPRHEHHNRLSFAESLIGASSAAIEILGSSDPDDAAALGNGGTSGSGASS